MSKPLILINRRVYVKTFLDTDKTDFAESHGKFFLKIFFRAVREIRVRKSFALRGKEF
jgi:hypothetical protein